MHCSFWFLHFIISFILKHAWPIHSMFFFIRCFFSLLRHFICVNMWTCCGFVEIIPFAILGSYPGKKNWQDLFHMSIKELTFTCLSSGSSIRPALMQLNFLCQDAMVPTSDSGMWRLCSASSPHTWGIAVPSSVSRTISQPTKI